ncbi:serpin-ZX, partial [Tanacetum coccineum]
ILSNPKSGLDFSLANGVWVDGRVAPVQSSYQEVLETVYRTESICVDFGIKLDDAVDVNSWVYKETNGLIPSVVERDDFDENIVIIIVNSLYFKGTWSNSFDADLEKDKDFLLINGHKVYTCGIDKSNFLFQNIEWANTWLLQHVIRTLVSKVGGSHTYASII